MRNGTTIGRGSIALYAGANALLSMAITVTVVWGGAPLAPMPWIISTILCASMAMCASIDREPVATPPPASAVNSRRARRYSQARRGRQPERAHSSRLAPKNDWRDGGRRLVAPHDGLGRVLRGCDWHRSDDIYQRPTSPCCANHVACAEVVIIAAAQPP